MKRIAVRAVIKKGNRFLLVQRTKHGSYGGQWQFPGGKSDGQTYHKALRREIREEVKLKPKGTPRFIGDIYANNTHSHQRYYRVKTKGSVRIQHSELDNFRWVTKKQALRLPLAETTGSILRRMRRV